MKVRLAERIMSRFGKHKPMLEEVAKAQAALAGGAFRHGYYSSDDLASRKGLAVYDEMQRDAQVRSCLNTKKFAVLSRGWDIRPASDEPRDLEIAGFIRHCLDEMRGSVQDVLFSVLDALANANAPLKHFSKPFCTLLLESVGVRSRAVHHA